MSTEAHVKEAWKKYQSTEKHGLELGQACCEYRVAYKSKGGYGSKGKGLIQLLEELSIPTSTAYYWMNRYEGKGNDKTNFNPAGTRGFKDKPSLSLFLRRLMAIGAVGITSPFPSIADKALRECDSKEAARAVVQNLNIAIERLSEYRTQFEDKNE